MRVSEHASTDAAPLRRSAVSCGAQAEFFSRDGGCGSLVVSEAGEVKDATLRRELELLFTGGHYGSEGGDWLFFVGLWTPAEMRDEFLAWYKIEHMPILLECKVWDGCRFVEQRVDKGCQFFAMHQLAERAALDSAERARSRATPWFKRLARHAWFDGAFTRTLYKRLAH